MELNSLCASGEMVKNEVFDEDIHRDRRSQSFQVIFRSCVNISCRYL